MSGSTIEPGETIVRLLRCALAERLISQFTRDPFRMIDIAEETGHQLYTAGA